jgi:tRNA-dihydrouridine synthase A
LRHVDGVMVGRQAYHEPWSMAGWDERFFGAPPQPLDRDAVQERYVAYLARLHAAGVPWGHAARPMIGLRNGLPGARRWRQVWSDPTLKAGPPHEALRLARAAAGLQNAPVAA